MLKFCKNSENCKISLHYPSRKITKWCHFDLFGLLGSYIIWRENCILYFVVVWLLSASKNHFFANNGWFFGFADQLWKLSLNVNKAVFWARNIDFLFEIFMSSYSRPFIGSSSHFCKKWLNFRIVISGHLLVG